MIPFDIFMSNDYEISLFIDFFLRGRNLFMVTSYSSLIHTHTSLDDILAFFQR